MRLGEIVTIWIVLAVLLTLWWHESERKETGQLPAVKDRVDTEKMRRRKMHENWISLWYLAGSVLVSAGAGLLAGAGLTAGLTLILAPGSLDEAWKTLRGGAGRFSAWLSCTFGPRPREEARG